MQGLKSNGKFSPNSQCVTPFLQNLEQRLPRDSRKCDSQAELFDSVKYMRKVLESAFLSRVNHVGSGQAGPGTAPDTSVLQFCLPSWIVRENILPLVTTQLGLGL